MSAVRKAVSEAAAKKGFTDTDSDEEPAHVAVKGGHSPLQPIPEQSARVSGSTRSSSTNMGDELTTVIIFGADGNLAKKKTFPALFNLMYKDLLADDVVVVGFARAELNTPKFRELVYKAIYAPAVPNQPRTHFLNQVTYESGQFNALEDFVRLRETIREREAAQLAEWTQRMGGSPAAFPKRVRLYYLAVPSFLYYDICVNLKESGIALDKKVDRFVLEKPFGRDSATCNELLAQLSQVLSEDVSYRIDHYLGKELIMNLLVLRFANICFESIWNHHHIASVQVIFKEKVGLDGRGGYFDQYGVIRDVMQNHLTQILALVTMEQPLSLSASHILQEKIKVLSSIRPLSRNDLVVGQYSGYLDEDSITNKNSRTETFAVAVLHINNPRWAGVPFVLKAGKALNENRAEVRIRFKHVPGAIPELAGCPENELIIRVQPNEGIYWKIQNKVPGLHFQVAPMRMDLTYQSKYAKEELPEAYERLILHVLHADKSHFVHAEELKLSWHIFSSVLHELEASPDARPAPYMRGTRGPAAADELAQRYGMKKFGSQRFEANTAPQAHEKWGHSERWAARRNPAATTANVTPRRTEEGVPAPKSEWPGNNLENLNIGAGAGGAAGGAIPRNTSASSCDEAPGFSAQTLETRR
eukprot:CAMPEP_0179852214 /NCGR_PEP_ID=MMETSP0982-20121206/8675_1 /TAXON_ID=483367 /ORGANISM="non described non described, Strain CCMP 2436" /LENGTH=643 /DNA_ID=CAMNT_0021737807 /DNA_START=27 /DNA_END=1958 /DNA_ORIENTATION=-